MDKTEFAGFTKNYLYLLLSQIVTYAFNFFIAVSIAKKLGVTHFGEFFLIATIQNFFLLIADFGINTLYLREVSKDRTLLNTYLNNIFALKLLLFIIAYILMQIFVMIFGYTAHIANLSLIFGLSMLPIGFSTLFIFTFRAIGRMDRELLTACFNGIVTILFLLWMYHSDISIEKVIMLWCFMNVLVMFFSFFVLKKTVEITLKPEYTLWRTLLSEAKYFLLYMLTSWVYIQIDTIMLSQYNSIDAVGLYQAAVKIVTVSVIFGDVMLYNFFPFISGKYREDPRKGKYLIGKISELTMAVVWPVLIAVIFFGKEALFTIYGPQYIQASLPLILLGIGYLFYYGPPYGIILPALGYQKINFHIALWAAVANIILNLILIPKYGIAGAAAATSLTYIGMKCIYMIVFVKLKLPIFSLNNIVFFFIILFMTILVKTFQTHFILGILLYILVIIFYIYKNIFKKIQLELTYNI